MKIPNLNPFHGLFLAVMSLFCSFTFTNAQKAKNLSPTDTLVNLTGGTLKFFTEEKIGGIDSGESVLREVFIYLLPDTTSFSLMVKSSYEKNPGKKYDTISVAKDAQVWSRVKVTDTSDGTYSWSRLKTCIITPVPDTGSVSWVSKPQTLNDTVSMQFAYTSNVKGVLRVYKGISKTSLYLSKTINVNPDTIGKSFFDFYKVPTGIETYYRIDLVVPGLPTLTTSIEKATPAPSKRTALLRVDSVWNEGPNLKIRIVLNAFGDTTKAWVRFGTTMADTSTTSHMNFNGYSNHTFIVTIPNQPYGTKIYYEANAKNHFGPSKDIQGYYIMPTKPTTFDIVINDVQGNNNKVTVYYTVYLAPGTTARVGMYRDDNKDMSSPEEQLDLITITQSGSYTREFYDVPKGVWYYSGWGNDSKGTIIDHGNVVMHEIKFSADVEVVKQIPLGEKDWMITNTLGQIVQANYTKDLSVRLSDSNLPDGIIYASTLIDGKLLQFKVFNHQEGGK